jgi:hypothetical protein
VHLDKSYQMYKKYVKHKPTKCTFSKLIFWFFKFTMSSTCFEPEGLSSGRRLYVQLWYIVFTCNSINSLVGGKVCSIRIKRTRIFSNISEIKQATGMINWNKRLTATALCVTQ